MEELNCLFLPTDFPNKRNPYAGIVFTEHLAVASSIFKSVVVISNLHKTKGAISRKIDDNTIIYEGKEPSSMWGRFGIFVTFVKYLLIGRKLVKENGLDVIWGHGIKWSGFWGALIAKITRKPFYLFIHSASPERERKIHLKFITNIEIKIAQHIFFVSSGQAANYCRSFEISSYSIVGNPVDIKNFDFKKHACSSNTVKILFSGRPTVEKGFPALLELIERISTEKLNVHFIILTDTNLLSPESKARVLEYSNLVKISHYLDKQGFADVLNDCSFLISLSQFESFSYVVAEALACGKPVIATDCDGPRELINKENGILIPVDDPAEVYRATSWMIRNHTKFDPLKIRKNLIEKYSFEVVRDKIVNSFKEVNAV